MLVRKAGEIIPEVVTVVKAKRTGAEELGHARTSPTLAFRLSAAGKTQSAPPAPRP
ncbi:MAG: hypothetical protein M1551_00225 [Firmicutes bacterium]|nr:hypothetical protein [Bacillota bacterium]